VKQGTLLLTLACILILLSGCAGVTQHQKVQSGQVPQRAEIEIAEQQLLDVWIGLFDPGKLPENESQARGLSMDIRKAEARYLPMHLRDVMEKTGYWGAVRVVPTESAGGELLVNGVILFSDGEKLELEIQAADATGKRWFSKVYEYELDPQQYIDREAIDPEVFQPLYAAIANDLAAYRAQLTGDELRNIRRVAEMRFAADMAPEAFSGYLQTDTRGRYTLQRLPADDDPMYRRVQAIRDRDFLLIDTLNGHFDSFYQEMDEPYFEWRKARSAEATELRELKREANTRKALGLAAILGAIAIEALGGESTSRSTGTLRNIMVVGGAYAIKTGFDKSAQYGIYQDAIEELGESFSSETRPMVVEVEGETHELTGSAEVQYSRWRQLLRQIHASETGLPVPAESTTGSGNDDHHDR
jgi:hypothetical protein